MSNTPFAEQTIRSLLQAGVAAYTATPTLLDAVWVGLSDDDMTRLKAVWASNPPKIISGYAREGAPFPLVAVTLLGDNPDQDYLGINEHWMDADEDEVFDSGELGGSVRTKGSFGIFIYAAHPDVCAAYYRAIKHVLNVARKALVQAGLQEPSLSGVELRPDARYTPDNLFVRQLTLTVDYEETWALEGPMATALGIAPPARLSPTGTIEALHEDQYSEDDTGIQPVRADTTGTS